MKLLIIILSGFFFVSTAVAQNVDLQSLTKNEIGVYLYQGKPYSGKVFSKHENGNIGLVGELKEGKKEGTWTYWYSTGEKKRESKYIANKKEGLTYYWYQNGQLAKEIMYRDDKNIDQKLWDENGNRKKNPTFDSFR